MNRKKTGPNLTATLLFTSVLNYSTVIVQSLLKKKKKTGYDTFSIKLRV